MEADVWRKAPDMTVARSYGAATAQGDSLVVLGGWDGKGMERLRSVEGMHVAHMDKHTKVAHPPCIWYCRFTLCLSLFVGLSHG
jgi:hypothetical protein